jgi:uncharacterized protein with von Willebrand factor type A (vWA) domain
MSLAAVEGDAVGVVVGFARVLRDAGVPASPDQVQSCVRALGHLDVASRAGVYWACRLTLCGEPDELARYDAAFQAYFGSRPPSAVPSPVTHRRQQQVALLDQAASDVGEAALSSDDLRARASAVETLRHRDFAELTEPERAEVRRLLALLDPGLPRRRSRRRAAAGRGGIDAPRTLRLLVRHAGEPAALARRAPTDKPRRVVLLVDVSGSMSPYADALVRFAHAVVRRDPAAVEVFTAGTRLTRLTRPLRHRDPDQALRAAWAAVPDFSGGTRLGEALRAFLDGWGQRGLARRAVVVVCSDGWERGDAGLLGEQMARLRRLAHQVLWVNPHQARAGFEPATAGMQAALPHVDALVAGHSLAALQRVARLVRDA